MRYTIVSYIIDELSPGRLVSIDKLVGGILFSVTRPYDTRSIYLNLGIVMKVLASGWAMDIHNED